MKECIDLKVNKYIFKIEMLDEDYILTFNDYYPIQKIKQDVDDIIYEYINAEELDIDEEVLEEINTTSITSYILDKLSDTYDYNVSNISVINTIHQNKIVGKGVELVIREGSEN